MSPWSRGTRLLLLVAEQARTEVSTLSLHDALPIYTPTARLASGTHTVTPLYLGATFTADRKSTRLNSSHVEISYAVFCLKKKKRWAPARSRRGPRPRHPASAKLTPSSAAAPSGSVR